MLEERAPVRGSSWALAAPAALAASVGAGLLAVAARNPHVPGSWLGECPLVVLTGWYCPFCNGLRSSWYVSQGEWGASLSEHPLVLPTILVALIAAVFWAIAIRRGRKPTRWLLGTLITVSVVFVGWTFWRNLGMPVL